MKNLRRQDLLDDYFARNKRRSGALVATALRTRSVGMRDILVHGAVRLNVASEELKQLCLAGELHSDDIVDVSALAELGRLVLLQNMLESDVEYGVVLLTLANEIGSHERLSRTNRRVLIQHHIAAGNHDIAVSLMEDSPDIASEYWGYLPIEMKNPFRFESEPSQHEWLVGFNRVFTEHNISPIALADTNELPFDRLTTSNRDSAESVAKMQPLVSVVLTAFNPEEAHLITSVRSILNQTWKNLELIVVDDCSAPEYDRVFEHIAAMDARVNVIHAPKNQGTYGARNIGYAVSQGSYITGQDDDDWSHPERIARQIEYLNKNPRAIGCRVNAVRCDENLGRLRVGYHPIGDNASSLLIRREGYEAVGGYLNARKAADTEFYYRLSAVTGRNIGTIKEPLSIIRILPDSLSRGDFQAGWKHPSRRTFRSSYEYWHRNSTAEELCLSKVSSPKVKIPRRFRTSEETANDLYFDIVFAGDWQQFGGPQKSMLEEIYALKAMNLRIGIMNLEAARFMSTNGQKSLNDQIQKLINEGFVDEVLYDENVHVRLLILRYPPILQFFTYEPSNISIDKMVILANQAPSELDGSDIRYLVPDCDANAKAAFGVSPTWIPQGPQVRRFLEYYMNDSGLAPFDLPGILNLDEWWHERLWYRSTIPVVGRHSRDNAMKWPAEKEVLKEIYRPDGAYDIRIMGGAKIPLAVMEAREYPAGWTVYKTNEKRVQDFLYSLDYFVFFQHPHAVEAFGRAILEALASGVVVILPRQFEEVFGDAALYAEPSEVSSLIENLHSDFSTYKSQTQRSWSVLKEHFSYVSYQNRVQCLLS